MTHDIEEEKLVNVFPTTYDRLLKEAGEHIIEFCKGYELFYGEIINHQEGEFIFFWGLYCITFCLSKCCHFFILVNKILNKNDDPYIYKLKCNNGIPCVV